MSKAKIVMVSIVWLTLLGLGVVLYRYWYVPREEQAQVAAAEAQQAAQQQVIEATSGSSKYRTTLAIALDGFSGYAVLRSEEFDRQLREAGIKLELVDDGADYSARLQGLASGKLQMAAFPVDALLKTSAAKGSLPATIVALLDETRGADALLAYKNKFPDIDSLNRPDTRFVLVGDSPSETLVRVLMHFFLNNVSAEAIVALDSEQAVLERYRAAKPEGNEVFVTWEPLVSELAENDQLHVLADSESQSGYIIDAFVVSRDYLIKHEAEVKTVLECYFRALYAYQADASGDGELSKLKQLVRDDSSTERPLTDAQVESIVSGIVWKNTQENFAHFGLRQSKVTYIEDMIDRIKRVLLETGAISRDPTDGQSNKLFFEAALAQLQSSNFHPGMGREAVRGEIALVSLTESQWQRLIPVGTLSVPNLVFPRGTAVLTERSQRILDELVEKLETWPQYYLLIQGNAGSRGDAAANLRLAKQRADAALQYLLSKDVPESRMRVVGGEVSGEMSVTFVLGQTPF